MLGNTCAWKVNHLDTERYEQLKQFLDVRCRHDRTIWRHRLEGAVRDASAASGRTLRLIRHAVIDATRPGEQSPRAYPVVAQVNARTYGLRLAEGLPETDARFAHLKRAYVLQGDAVHSTVVADVVLRYVRDRLTGIPLRALGGVYFVSAKKEKDFFRLKDYLDEKHLGQITHIRVVEDVHHVRLLTEEIRALLESRLSALQAAIRETNPDDAKRARAMGDKVAALRRELTTLGELFGFARETIEASDRQARRMIRRLFETGSAEGLDLLDEHYEILYVSADDVADLRRCGLEPADPTEPGYYVFAEAFTDGPFETRFDAEVSACSWAAK